MTNDITTKTGIIKPKILVIDDEDSIRLFILELLKETGYEGITARDGIDGLECLSQNPNAIILDENMPRMGGVEFYNKLKTDLKYEKQARIPIVGIGSTFTPEMKAKFEAYVSKPIDNMELLDAIKKVLGDYIEYLPQGKRE